MNSTVFLPATGRGIPSSQASGSRPRPPPPPTSTGWRQLPKAEAPDSDPDRPTAAELIEAGIRAVADPAAADPVALLASLQAAYDVERDPALRQDLLATSIELAVEHDLDAGAAIDRALQEGQPEDLRREALYLASATQPELLEQIAADRKHPLHTDAAAFLLELRLESGEVPAPVDERPQH